ncbi:MAG: hypothetical protein M3548_20050 [Actinomycetota bacterium]|nr:hypothetical protein [Actinomycetota bacterium]
MSTEPTLRITLQPEWGTGPIWITRGDDISEPYDADEVTHVLDLSDELCEAIAAWDDRFQATFNDEYPPDSAFPTPDEEASWLTEGKQLAVRLRREIPEAAVAYETIDGKQIALDDETP